VTSQYDLLDKNELRVTDIGLAEADLSTLAAVAAGVLGLTPDEILVTDYLDHTLTFDVLRPTIYPHQLVGRSDDLLNALRAVPGVTLSARSQVTANGMLGWIAADSDQMTAALTEAQSIAEQVSARVAKRVAVFSTGAELVSGEVKDTNWSAISSRLTEAGFSCEHLGTLADDEQLIAGSIRRAAGMGFGVVLTTGGVGAEAKDCTVEAVLSLVADAVTRYTCHFTAGHGRHTKDGVRIAVGTYRGCRVISLPGPNDEVRACLDHIVSGLWADGSDEMLASAIAQTLRQLLRDRMADAGGQS
jgi:molybdenum cofactor synthesis domain-containing protein